MDAPETLVADPKPQPAITDQQMDTNRIYEQEHERPQQVSSDEPIQLAQNDVPDIYIGGRQLKSSNNVHPQLDTDAADIRPIVSTRRNLGNDKQIIYNNESGITDNSRDSLSHQSALALAERGQPRDLNNWSNGEADKLVSDQATQEEEEQNARGLAASKISKVTHNIVQAPDGAKVAFPKGTSPETMHAEMQKWWEPRVKNAQAAWDSVRHAANQAAQAVGLPADQPEWQLAVDDFMRDPIDKTTNVVGAVIGGLAHGFNSIIPSTPENTALAERAQHEYEQGNSLAAASTLIPLIGDNLAKAVKQAQSKDFSGSIGTTIGTVAPFLTDTLKGEGELPITREKAVPPTTTSYEHTPAQNGQFGNYEHVVTTKNAEGHTVGHLAAQDTAPGQVTIRSNQIYDEAHRGVGKGTAAIRTLVNETAKNPDLKVIHSDITTTGAARGAWEKLAEANPDTVTKETFNGVPRWSVDLDKVREKASNAPEFNGEERRGNVRGPLMSPTQIETNLKTGQPVSTPFDATQGAMDTINRDLASRLEPKPKSPTPEEDTAFWNKKEAEAAAEPRFTGNGSFRQAAVRNLDKKQYDPSSGFTGKTGVPKALSADDLRTLRLGGELKSTVGTAEGAARDSEMFAKAKEKLGSDATFSQVAQEAQRMKDAGSKGEPLEVRHWSKQGTPLTETDPEKFGTGRAGAEKSRASETGFLPRTYFGMEGYREPEVQSGLEHTATLDSSKYYNVTEDPKGIWKKAFAEGGATEAEKAVKKAGYDGYYNPEQQVAASFGKVPVKVDPESSQLLEHRKNGGSTFTPEGKSLKGVNKYAVGSYMPRMEEVDRLTPDVLRAFKNKNSDLTSQPNHSVGTWYDPDTNKHILDISKLYDDRDEAIAAGKLANQKAIYHLDGEGEIKTGGTGQNLPEVAAAQKDFQVEKDFSKDLLDGKKNIQEFPYYDSYKRTIDAESKELPKGGKILFIGGGPVPLSSMLLADKGFIVDTLELDPETAKLGEQVAQKSGASTGKFIAGDARDFKNYGDYDGVVTALEAGPESASKQAVLKNIMDQVKTGTPVLARGTADAGGEAFVNTAKSLPDNAQISKSIDTFDGLSKTHVLDKSGPTKLSDLWHDETGTYTSGAFMRYLAKNKLMSPAGKDVLDAAAKDKIVPGWAEVSQFLTPEDRAQASLSVQKNVVDLVNKFNPEWVSDAAKAGSAAKGWYSRATGLIQHMFGDEAHRFTNFVASLSPQKDVEQNFTDALNFYNMWQDAGKPLGPDNEKVIRDLTERAEVGMSGQVARNQLYENLVNEVQPTGPKVSNFARNLKGNMDAVTKDRWMAYLFGNNERMFRWFKEGSPKPAVHLAADALIRAVGQSIGMLPAEVQETSWSFLRTVVNLTEKEKISPKEAIGRVNDQLIREGASELTRLIADSPKVQSALNRLATATGDERFRADTLQNSPRFKQLLQEHAEQPSTGGGAGAINRAGAERGVKQAIKARSEISAAKKAKASSAPAEETPAPKKAPKDKATEFNPSDMSKSVRPTLSEKMKNALA